MIDSASSELDSTPLYKLTRGADMAEKGDGAEASGEPVSLDMEAMIDEIIAKKGPQKYQDGLSEDNWEEVDLWRSMSFTSLHK